MLQVASNGLGISLALDLRVRLRPLGRVVIPSLPLELWLGICVGSRLNSALCDGETQLQDIPAALELSQALLLPQPST